MVIDGDVVIDGDALDGDVNVDAKTSTSTSPSRPGLDVAVNDHVNVDDLHRREAAFALIPCEIHPMFLKCFALPPIVLAKAPDRA